MAGEYIEFNNLTQPAVNDTNLNLLQRYIKQDIQAAVSGDTLPVGAILPFGSDIIPDNWLLCNGQEVSRTDYYQLFDVIGTTFGQGDGFTTFKLPNLQGKIPVGLDSNDEDFDTLAETGGEKEHTLTIEEMPSHNHNGGSNTDGIVQHLTTIVQPYTVVSRGTSGEAYKYAASSDVGGGEPHNILQPYIVTNYIIKAQQSAGVIATVVDDLNSTSSTNALSANQGNVLNEKIETLITYSTDETNTRKKWLDGKKIYSKVIQGTIGSTTANIDVPSEIETLIHAELYMKNNTNVIPIPAIDISYSEGTSFAGWNYLTNNSSYRPNSIYIVKAAGKFSDYTIVYGIIEYTKTTD